ncbi:MAG: MFS transporter [Actinomycetota bacterium]
MSREPEADDGLEPEYLVDFVGEEPTFAWPLWWRARRSEPDTRERSPWFLLAVVLTGLFATGFSVTILAVSLPEVADSLGASVSLLTFAVTGPFLALALAMPVLGKLGDVHGHRRVYLLGLSGFATATLATAFAWNAPSLIALRVVAAIGGAATGPASMAMVMHAFPHRERAKAMGWWSLVGGGAPVIGLVAGGPLVDAIGWRAIFLVQAPLAGLAVVLGAVVLPETTRRPSTDIDWWGAGLLATATVAGLGALQFGGEIGWTNPWLLVPVAVAGAAFAAFLRVERRVAAPLIPPMLLRQRNYGSSVAAQWCTNFAYMGGYIVTPVLVQEMFGFSVGQASFAMVIRPLMFSITAPFAGYVAVRVGERRCALFGTTLLVVAMATFFAASIGETLALVFVGLAVGGVAHGSASPCLVTVAANDVPHEDLGVGNAAQQMMSQIGTVAGIQAMSAVSVAHSAGGFATAYAIGVVVATGSVLATLRIRDRRHSPEVATGPVAATR